jgi:hypothetical protein
MNSMKGEQPLPYSEDGEKGVICALLRAPGKTAQLCANRIVPRMFSSPVFGLLFDVITEWPIAEQEVSLSWLVHKMTSLKQLDAVGGKPALNELYDFEPTTANAEFNINLVVEAYVRRELILKLEALKGRCFDGRDEVPDILKTAKETLSKIDYGLNGNQRLSALLDCSLGGAEFGAIKIPQRTPIIKDWLMEGDLGFVYAYRGSGKTWFVLSLSSALAKGSKCGPWQVLGQWPVLYIDGEMMSADIQERIKALNGGKAPANLYVLNHEILYHKSELVLNLASPTEQQLILQVCLKKKIRVLVLDNLGCLFSGVKENDADEWEKVLPWLLELRRYKIAVVIVHHTGVDASRMRGTTKREDPAGFSIRLDDKKEDFREAGACFITRFKKYRGREPLLDYEWDYRPNGTEVLVTCREANRADVVLQWVRDGLEACGEIATEMGLSSGQVSKLATRLIAEVKLKKNRRRYEVVEV